MPNSTPRAFIPWRNTAKRYGIVAQSLHWTVVALVIVQFVLGFTAAGMPISMQRLMLLANHKSIGLTILALVILRLAWRGFSPAPALPVGMPLQRRAAHVSHVLLYGLLITMPIVGWITSSASHLTVTWFGLFPFPNLVGPDAHLAKLAKATHAAMAWLLLATASLHALAALWHHFVQKDDVLLRMLPLPVRTRPRENRS
ncbi:MAG TPA: cytochrome b [Gammaproteobacteria bacterium]|jgi:cytochrome b561|nr:cytochrome b [Gammaproteobacteria bacterium]